MNPDMSNLVKSVLPNGVRILCEHNDTVRSAAVGLTCQTGSRHELAGEEGITHFIEHMLFKGTPSRSARDIAESIEGQGGILNAFTDKEQTTYYCRVLGQDVSNALDVLSDMMQHSLFDPEEMGREKGVVLEEISRSEDEPGDHVHELHIGHRWGQHPLGKPIIGTRETVQSFTRDMIVGYMDRRYRGGHVVLSVAGDIDPDAVVAQATELLGGLASESEVVTATPPTATPQNNLIGKQVEQVHFCIGGDSVGIHDPRIYTVSILDSILGGGMSSRLFQELRERRGLAYSVGSYTLSYSSGGLFTIYGGTSMATWDQVQELALAEVQKVVHEGLRDGELARIKRQMSGNMVIALEGMNSRMLRMTKNELHFGREIPIDETLGKIEAVTEQMVRDFAAEFLAPERMSITAIGPFAA